MQTTATRIIGFDAGHRVMNHESKCATLHGHRYTLEATASSKELDTIGRVIDFSQLKEILGGWIDSNWDHNVLVYERDIVTLEALQNIPRKKEPFVCQFNPTAENMCNFLIDEVCPNLFSKSDIKIIKVKLWETPNCFAEAVR